MTYTPATADLVPDEAHDEPKPMTREEIYAQEEREWEGSPCSGMRR